MRNAKTRFIVVLGLWALATNAHAQGYSYEIIARSGDTHGSLTVKDFGNARIDNAGNVVYRVDFVSGEQGLARGSQLVIAPDVFIDGVFVKDVSGAAVSNSGLIAFRAVTNLGHAIFTPTRLIAKDGDTIDGVTVTLLGDPEINDSGDVAFPSALSDGKAVLTPTRLIARTGDTIGGKTVTDIFASVRINDRGEVSYHGTFAGGTGVFVDNRLVAGTGDLAAGVPIGGVGVFPDINRRGEVLFFANLRGGNPPGLFTEDSQVVSVNDVIGSSTLTGIVGAPSMNDSGEVAFQGSTADGPGINRAIFTQHRRVVRIGDTLDGRTIAGLTTSPEINSSGEIAFVATFADLAQVIVRATPPDSDGDGIRDLWEEEVFFVAEPDGTAFPVDLATMGASPIHKDLFVRIDYMQNAEYDHRPVDLDPVVAAFANAPVTNPDSIDGITLHVMIEPGPVGAFVEMLGTGGSVGTYRWRRADGDTTATVFFDDIKEGNVSLGLARHFPKELTAVSRACLFAHRIADLQESGIARGVPTSDFIVSLGAFVDDTDPTPRRASSTLQTGTFMHELGHVLGLRHGGGDETNYKPNYLSVMSYSFQKGLRKDGSITFDYSRVALSPLLEFALNEAEARKNWPASVSGYATTWFRGISSFSTQRWTDDFVPGGNNPIDWNQNGDDSETAIVASINRDFGRETLNGFDDWANLSFTGGTVGAGRAAPLPVETPTGELDVETAKLILPAPIGGLAARAGRGSVRLGWNPGGLRGDVTYRISRKLQGAAAFTELATTTSTLFVDRTVARRKTYVYTVTMTDGLGVESLASEEITVRVR